MLRRGVDRIEFQRLVAFVDDVVPLPGRDEDRIVVFHVAYEVELILAVAHHHLCHTLFDAQELVDAHVLLQPYIPAYGNRHQRDLQVVTRPEHRPEILVPERVAFDVQDGRFRPVILQYDGRCCRQRFSRSGCLPAAGTGC